MAIKINKDIQIDTTGVTLENLQKYSTTETKVGTDDYGKPIYRRIFTGTTTSQTGVWENIGNLTNAKDITLVICTTRDGGGSLVSFDSIGDIKFYIDYSNNIMLMHSSWYNGCKYRMTFEYTKTTD